MQKLLDSFDRLAEPTKGSVIARWLERVSFVFLVLLVVAAPHSIAGTQVAWLIGMFIWLIRLMFRPRVAFRFTWFDAALWGLFGWSVVSAFFSYDPPTSFDRLRVVALFLIFYFVFYNVRNLRAAYFLAFVLILSCMVNVAWTPVQRWLGRGIEIHGIDKNGPLGKAGLIDGDTLDRANNQKLGTPDDVVEQLSKNEVTTLEFYRGDFETDAKINRADLLDGEDAQCRLGFESWSVGKIIRASGFYRHYVTYAEVLQLIGSLVFGLFVSAFSRKRWIAADDDGSRKIPAWLILLFIFCCMGLVMLLTITRAPQLALIISGFTILVVSGNRKLLLAMAAVALPVMVVGLIYLQQQRHIGFFDAHDESTQYRQTMWRDGFRLWTASPRNFVFGIGMDSIKAHWQEWNMFDGGRLPVSHFHSTPMQLLVERGLPALLLWLAILGIYARTLWREIRQQLLTAGSDWRSTGILLGCLGGAIGFFVCGLVQYDLGDSVVAMAFYLLLGLGMRTVSLSEADHKVQEHIA